MLNPLECMGYRGMDSAESWADSEVCWSWAISEYSLGQAGWGYESYAPVSSLSWNWLANSATRYQA